jgi:GNAT superfamily N-acetyltransferase
MDIKSTKKRQGNVLALIINNKIIYDPFITSQQPGDSYLYAHYYNDNYHYMYITTLFTKPEYREKKYASHLLKRAIYEAKKNKCKKIHLMDCSDLCHKENNIYIKHGFKYDEIGQPDMTFVL